MAVSESELAKVDAELSATERRREWMSGVVSSLKARNHPARVAERQLADFAIMLVAMRKHRKEIENAIVAQRDGSVAMSVNDGAIDMPPTSNV
ncbi:hypothetical protein [Rhizobium sp.]